MHPSLFRLAAAAALGALALTTRPTLAAPSPTGTVEYAHDGTHLVVCALRDDVLALHYWHGATPPESGSWAVLPAAQQSRVGITPLSQGSGFTTTMLRVEVDPATLEVKIYDKAGTLLEQDAAPVKFRGSGFALARAMPVDAHYFGLGDKVGPFDRRGESFTLWNTDAYAWQESTDPLYKAIPFFLTFDRGVTSGTLLDTTWRSRFDFGHIEPSTLAMSADGGPVDLYFLYGPSPKQVLADYAWLTGPTPLPPRWSLGFQQSRFSYTPQAQVEQLAQRFRADHVPADAIYLDVDFQDRYRPFTVDAKTFPDLPGLVRTLHSEQFHVVAITDLHIAKAPNQGYTPYDSGTAQDRFVHMPDGSVFSGIVWPGLSVFPDFTEQQTRAWWGSLYTDFVHIGLDGFWNDMNEPSVFKVASRTMPLNVQHRIDEPGFAKRTATHAEIHNVYGMENARATEEGLLKLEPDERPFVLTRAAYAGTQRYAATWTGDNSATWNHLRLTTSMLKNLGLSGFSMAGADGGGYAGTPSPELLTKWLEISAFQPIDRDHAEKGTGPHEVWANGPGPEAVRRRYIEERYKLMPYLYTAADEASHSGLPILRPLFVEFPDAMADKHPMDADPDTANEFLFGPDLLIAAPMNLEQTADYSVRFPSDGWYNYWTGARVAYTSGSSAAAGVQPESGAVVKTFALRVTPKLEELPVFVRPGSIVPSMPLTQSTEEKPAGPLTLRVYPGPDCHGAVYWDDGHSFAYRQGAFARMAFRCESMPDGSLQLHLGAREGSYQPWWSELEVQVFGLAGQAPQVTENGKTVPASSAGEAVRFAAADTGQARDFVIR